MGSDIWRTLAAMLDVSYIYMGQRDLPGFAFEPELKNKHTGGVCKYVRCLYGEKIHEAHEASSCRMCCNKLE